MKNNNSGRIQNGDLVIHHVENLFISVYKNDLFKAVQDESLKEKVDFVQILLPMVDGMINKYQLTRLQLNDPENNFTTQDAADIMTNQSGIILKAFISSYDFYKFDYKSKGITDEKIKNDLSSLFDKIEDFLQDMVFMIISEANKK